MRQLLLLMWRAQRSTRHASPLTTTGYTQPGDDELQERVRALGC